jgi:hypothetical protein
VVHHFEAWFDFVKSLNPGYGIPMVIVGLTLMFMGLQFHRTAVPFIFILLGVIAGQFVAEDMLIRIGSGLGIGAVLAAFGVFYTRPAVALLGGVISGAALLAYIGVIEIKMPETIWWAVGAVGLVSGAALSFVVHRETIIVLTSLVGSLLFVSGLNPVLDETLPAMHSTIRSFLGDYPGFFVPFMFGGPTLIASLVQMAMSNQEGERKS